MSWKEFKDNTDGEDTRISYGASGAEKTEKGCYYPVSPNYQLNYDGQKNKVSDVSVNIASDAGMFGKIDVSGSSVSNLDLLDFSINGSTSAGALAGSISNCTVTNVLAHNSISKTTNKEKLSENIKASGYAGGLIGNLSSGGTIVNCAAALWVESSGSSAGGLIGSLSGDRVITSYAGGHTENGQYSNTTFNVTGSTAGGLIGTMTSGTVSNSYSTCSASGTTAGGFVGNGSGGRITNCYCTGLVLKPSDSTDKHGAFAGEWSASALSCQYFDIINEHGDAANGFTSLTALGGNRTNSNITAFDTSAEEYEKFCGSNWDSATPYDGILNGYYSGKFNLRTVAQIGKDPKTKTTDMSSYVSTHYGDWPAPEAFVVNKGNSSGNSLNPTP